MATISIIDKHSAAIATMDNGAAVPVPPGYMRMEIDAGGSPDVVHYSGGSEMWLTDYDMPHGLDRDLADGETYTDPESSTWTRHGDEMVVWTPPAKLAA